jgi:hypothetical protein
MKELTAAAVLLLVVPALASAQNTNHQYRGQGYVFFGLGTSMGYPFSYPAVRQLGFGGEGFLFKGLGLGAEVGYAWWGGYDDAYVGSVDVSYHFRRGSPRRGADPFVLGGFTLYAPTSHGERGTAAGNFGGGVNLWVKEHAALRLEVRDHVNGNSGFGPPFGPGNHYLSFRVGMTFR